MHYEADTHTHTLASGHAYNTIMEMVQAAAAKGLKALAITDHTKGVPGHEMKGAPEDIYFRNFVVIPRDINGVHLLMGAEVNILNGGSVDLSERALRQQDIVIASIHKQCYDNEGLEANTQALLKVIENPYVDIIGHPDDSNTPSVTEAPATGDESTKDSSTKDSSTKDSSSASSGTTPKTSDVSNLILWIVIAAVCLAGIIGVAVFYKKRYGKK